jgi:hypothetical protein
MQVRRFSQITRDPEVVVVANYTTENGYLLVEGSSGTVTLLIPPADMAAYEAGNYVYDLEVESPESETTRIVQGKFIVRAEVTR